MKKIFGFLLILILVISCSTAPNISSEDIRVMTTRVYKKPMKDVFYAARNMVANREYTILSADLENGFIKGYSEVQTSDEIFNVLIGHRDYKNSIIDVILTPRGDGVEVKLLVSEQYRKEEGLGLLDVLALDFKFSKKYTKLIPIYNIDLYNYLFLLIQKEFDK